MKEMEIVCRLMKRCACIAWSLLCVGLYTGCTADDVTDGSSHASDPRELTGIQAVIAGAEGTTRAGVVTTLRDYVGRSEFKSGDKVVFTDIRRTENSMLNFTYPKPDDTYEGIVFEAGSESGWSRNTSFGPERVYWTDAESEHTFIAYGMPNDAGFDWKRYKPTSTSSKNWYIGSLGDPTQPGLGETGYDEDSHFIDYYPDDFDQTAYTTTENNVTTYRNPLLDKEDLFLAYDKKMLAEPGGSVALVKFFHGLSSIRVVVNISGFSSSATAADNETKVSNMRLLHQPTMYIWMQENNEAQPLRSEARDGTSTDQDILNSVWGGEANAPKYNQRKDIRLWIPEPDGHGDKQSKTFTFYGITVPQPASYVSTLHTVNPYRMVELQFDVTYPNPMDPTATQTKRYTAKLPYGSTYSDGNPETDDTGVHFEAGYNTTINISLNHKNEQMTVGAEYENWNFVATPDQGRLKMNSTFLQDVLRANVTIADDAAATIDDATWLYKSDELDENNEKYIKDVYGHKGTSKEDAYQISTAYQLLSFAYEVKSGRTFKDKYVRLDSDITLQKSTSVTSPEIVSTGEDGQSFSGAQLMEWIGIGESGKPFDGIFIGGDRYINRLYGSPLFAELGKHAVVKQLNVSAISINNDKTETTAAVTGGGLFAEVSAGRISGCRVVGDVTLSGNTGGYAGAFVGQNFIGTDLGALYASYHVGDTKSTGTTTYVGGLVGNNGNGIVSSCFQAGVVAGGSTANRGIAGENTGDNIYNTYFNSSLFTYSNPSVNVLPKTTAEMTKEQFVTDLNNGINTWRESHSDYDSYTYVYQPANYPRLNN